MKRSKLRIWKRQKIKGKLPDRDSLSDIKGAKQMYREVYETSKGTYRQRLRFETKDKILLAVCFVIFILILF